MVGRAHPTTIATKNLTRYWNDTRKRIDIDVENDLSPIFHVQNVELKQALWYPQYLMNEGNVNLGINLKARSRFLRTIDSMNDREFEALACVVCNLLGAHEVHLTPPGNEGGIDFYALIRFPSESHIFGALNKSTRIVGQSKNYAGKESITGFRSFLTSLGNVRSVHGSVTNHMPNWFMRGTGPIIGWYVAKSGYQSGVTSFAREQGVVLSEAVDLAEVLATNLVPDSAIDIDDKLHTLADKVSNILPNTAL